MFDKIWQFFPESWVIAIDQSFQQGVGARQQGSATVLVRHSREGRNPARSSNLGLNGNQCTHRIPVQAGNDGSNMVSRDRLLVVDFELMLDGQDGNRARARIKPYKAR